MPGGVKGAIQKAISKGIKEKAGGQDSPEPPASPAGSPESPEDSFFHTSESEMAAERAVLGSLLIDPNLFPVVQDILTAHDFYRPQHQIVYNTLQKLWQETGDLDPVVVKNRISTHSAVQNPYGFIVALQEEVAWSGNVEYYARIVKESSLRRTLRRGGERLIRAAKDRSQNPDEIRAKAVSWLEEMRPAGGRSKHISEILTVAMQKLLDEDTCDMETGIWAIDNNLGGMNREEMWVIAGESGSGKTALITQVILNAAQNGHGAVIYETELPGWRISQNMQCQLGKINTHNMRRRKFEEGELDRMEEANDKLAELPIWIDASQYTLEDTLADAYWLCQKEDISIIAVDHAQRLKVNGAKEGVEKITKVAVELKQLARKTETCVLLASQITEKDRGYAPRWGQELRNEADIFLFLHPPKDVTFGDTTDDADTYRHMVASKIRGGGTYDTRLRFYGPHLWFSEYYRGKGS
jgi:replicative DNA helicase